VRKTLLSLQIRPPATMGEQLAALPFTIGDTAGYHVDRTIENKAAVLSSDAADPQGRAVFFAMAMPDRIPPADQANAFARQGLSSLNDIDGVEVESERMIDLGGQQGHELVVRGNDRATGTPMFAIQWLRPTPSGLLRYVGVGADASRETLKADFARLRDAIAPKSEGAAAATPAPAP
jgi:hypothetical protein